MLTVSTVRAVVSRRLRLRGPVFWDGARNEFIHTSDGPNGKLARTRWVDNILIDVSEMHCDDGSSLVVDVV